MNRPLECVLCKKTPVRPFVWSMETVRPKGPWGGVVVLSEATCTSCGHRISWAEPDFGPAYGWVHDQQYLGDSDHTIVFPGRDNNVAENPGHGITVFWAWCPFPADHPFKKALMDRVRRDAVNLCDPLAMRLLVASQDDVKSLGDMRLFDQFWGLDKSVMAGSHFWAPSIKAERSVYHTTAAMGMNKFFFYWPDMILRNLPNTQYSMVYPDARLATEWSDYIRTSQAKAISR